MLSMNDPHWSFYAGAGLKKGCTLFPSPAPMPKPTRAPACCCTGSLKQGGPQNTSLQKHRSLSRNLYVVFASISLKVSALMSLKPPVYGSV